MEKNKKSQSNKNVNITININVNVKTDTPKKTNKVELYKNITLLVGGLINLILTAIRFFK